MSGSGPVYLSSIFDEVALGFGDVSRTRITNDHLLIWYNAVARDIGSRVDAVRYQAYFDLQVDDAYTYPDEATTIVAVRVSDNPSDPYNFIDLVEMTEDEYRGNTRLRYPAASRPTHYWPTNTLFHLWPHPAAVIVGGGLIDYYGLPDEVTNWQGAQLPFPAFLRNWVKEGIEIEALKANKQYAEAQAAYTAWAAKEQEYKDRIEDRSDDRRPRLRVRSNVRGVQDLV